MESTSRYNGLCSQELRGRALALLPAVLLVLFVTAQTCLGQSAITRSTFGSGGQVVASDAYRLVGTLGQALSGTTQGRGLTFNAGYWTRLNPFTSTSFDNVADQGGPAGFALAQNYPNPFGGSTRIPFDVAETSHVTLEVFDILGRRVVALVDETLASGRYEAALESDGLVAGMYLYRIRMAGFEQTKQMIIVR